MKDMKLMKLMKDVKLMKKLGHMIPTTVNHEGAHCSGASHRHSRAEP